jgi:translocation and assembly module TamB
LGDLEILSLLATGEESWTTGPATTAGETEAALQATSLLYGQAASLVAQRTGRLFGLDRFRVQPLTTASGELSSARVTVGKQLSRDLSVTYSYDPSTTAEQVFEIEWLVERGVTLLLRQNGDESYGVDVVWKKSF